MVATYTCLTMIILPATIWLSMLPGPGLSSLPFGYVAITGNTGRVGTLLNIPPTIRRHMDLQSHILDRLHAGSEIRISYLGRSAKGVHGFSG